MKNKRNVIVFFYSALILAAMVCGINSIVQDNDPNPAWGECAKTPNYIPGQFTVYLPSSEAVEEISFTKEVFDVRIDIRRNRYPSIMFA